MSIRRRQVQGVGAAVAVAAALLLSSCSSDAGAAPSSSGPTRSITTSATGTASGTPDQITANVGISNQGASAAAVLSENSAKTQRLLDELKIGGIDDKDVTTTSVDLGPTYDKAGKITGYQASNQLRVTLRNLKTAGAQLDRLVAAGGDQARIQGIALGFQDDDELLTKARIDAVKRARAQAKEMAEAGGAELGAVRTITDSTPVQYALDQRSMGADSAASAVPIAPGSQDLDVRVKVVFTLQG